MGLKGKLNPASSPKVKAKISSTLIKKNNANRTASEKLAARSKRQLRRLKREDFDTYNKQKRDKFSLAGRKRLSDSHKGDKNPAKRPDVQKRIRRTLIKRSEAGKSKEEIKRLRKQRKLKWLRKNDPAKYKEIMHRKASARARKVWRNPKTRANRIAGIKKAWGPEYHDARYEKVFTPEYRKKLSKLSRGRDMSGRVYHRKKKYPYVGVNGRITMQMQTEVNYAKYLDSKGIKWLFEPVTFMLGKRSWTPDFLLLKENVFVEVKGWYLPDVKWKIERVIKHFPATKFKLLLGAMSNNNFWMTYP